MHASGHDEDLEKSRVRFILENKARSDCRIIAQEVIKFHDGYFPETATSVDHSRKKKIQLTRLRAIGVENIFGRLASRASKGARTIERLIKIGLMSDVAVSS